MSVGQRRFVAYKAYTPYTPYKKLAGIFFDTRECEWDSRGQRGSLGIGGGLCLTSIVISLIGRMGLIGI